MLCGQESRCTVMIKDNQKYFNRLHLLMDALIVACSYILAWYLRFESIFASKRQGIGVLGRETYFYALYFIVPAYIILYYFFNMYTSKRTSRKKYEVYGILKSNTVGVLLFLVVLYVINQPNFSRTMIVIFYIINIVLTTLSRQILRNALHYFRRKGYNPY